jgi:hypothetical protein
MHGDSSLDAPLVVALSKGELSLMARLSIRGTMSMGDMGVAKRDQEGIIIRIVDTGSILVIVFQNKASDCFQALYAL